MIRLIGCLLFAFSVLCASPGLLTAQSALRLPAALMINFLNRTQQIAYAIGMSDWKMLRTEAEKLGENAAAYAKIVPPGIPMGKQLRTFQEDVAALFQAADGRDGEAAGRRFGRIEAGCVSCHKRYRDL